jgi:hypothetical protein
MTEVKEDDPSIQDDDGLLRRVPNWPNMVKLDKNTNTYRPTSVCFSDQKTNNLEVSITLQKPLHENGGADPDAIKNYPNFGLARIPAGFVRNNLNHKQIVTSEPTEDDPYHGLIVGTKDSNTKRTMAKAATLLINPKID